MNARMPLAAIAVPALLAVTGLCAAMASSTEPARPVAAPQPSAQDAKPTAQAKRRLEARLTSRFWPTSRGGMR